MGNEIKRPGIFDPHKSLAQRPSGTPTPPKPAATQEQVAIHDQTLRLRNLTDTRARIGGGSAISRSAPQSPRGMRLTGGDDGGDDNDDWQPHPKGQFEAVEDPKDPRFATQRISLGTRPTPTRALENQRRLAAELELIGEGNIGGAPPAVVTFLSGGLRTLLVRFNDQGFIEEGGVRVINPAQWPSYKQDSVILVTLPNATTVWADNTSRMTPSRQKAVAELALLPSEAKTSFLESNHYALPILLSYHPQFEEIPWSNSIWTPLLTRDVTHLLIGERSNRVEIQLYKQGAGIRARKHDEGETVTGNVISLEITRAETMPSLFTIALGYYDAESAGYRATVKTNVGGASELGLLVDYINLTMRKVMRGSQEQAAEIEELHPPIGIDDDDDGLATAPIPPTTRRIPTAHLGASSSSGDLEMVRPVELDDDDEGVLSTVNMPGTIAERLSTLKKIRFELQQFKSAPGTYTKETTQAFGRWTVHQFKEFKAHPLSYSWNVATTPFRLVVKMVARLLFPPNN